MPGPAIESLESRTLMAQTAGQLVTQIFADIAASKATVAASPKIASSQEHTLAADLRHTGAANAALLKTLNKDFTAALANIRGMQARTALLGSDIKKTDAALNTANIHNFSTKTVAALNKASAKLSTDDNTFVSSPVFNAFYNITIVPEDQELTIQSANPGNTALTAVLPALEPAANFATALYPQFNGLVQDISSFATIVINTGPGTT